MENPNEQQRSEHLVRAVSTRNFALSERCYGSHMESPLHAHKNNYIIITLNGRYFSTFDTRTEEYKPWTVTYLRSGASHSSRYTVSGARVLYVELPMETLKGIWQISASHLNHMSLQGGVADWAARQLYNEFNSFDTFSPVVMDGYIMQLLAHLQRRRLSSPGSMPTWLGNADELIRSRFTEPIALDGIAKQVSVHPVHLAREYRRYYSCTIGEQIRRLRIEYACEQLTGTGQCLSDIALAAGFSDQSHFTVSFKQYTGSTPSQYRRASKTMLLPQKSVSHTQDPTARSPILI